MVTSIPMISAQMRKGHGANFLAPFVGQSCHLIGGLFVDDTNLFHLNMRWVKTAHKAHSRLQDLVINWGKLLLATGGALKPVKCSFYLVSF
jgi:hypothetical protein